jgi:hypothetical protein
MKTRLAMVAAAMLAASQARAAEVTERASPNSVAGGYAFDRVITISGELEKGDADKFRTAISRFDHLLVELNGPGGLLGVVTFSVVVQGLTMPMLIRRLSASADFRRVLENVRAH